MKSYGRISISVLFLIAALSVGVSFKAESKLKPDGLFLAMGDVDTYAGLSTPVRVEKPGLRDAAKICLALNAYYEARSGSFEGQVAVNQVALRRAGLDYKHVCEEIYKPAQFSWTEERPKNAKLPTGTQWQWALAAAEESLQWAAYPDKHIDHSNKATYFHAYYVKPYWTRGLELVAIKDGHRFYR